MAAIDDLQAQLDGILTQRRPTITPQAAFTSTAAAPPTTTRRSFSAFRLTDVARANKLASHLMEVAQSTRAASGGDREVAVKAALDEAERSGVASAEEVEAAFNSFRRE